DLAVANYGSTPPGGFSGDGSTVSVLLGTVTGSFTAGPTLNVGHRSTFVAVGDFNGDTSLDLAVPNYGATTVSVLLGNVGGTFQAPQGFDAGIAPGFVAVADVNGDGLKDLIVPNLASNTVSVLLGAGLPRVTPAPVLNPAGGTFILSVRVTITDGTAGAAIYYTTDGSTPTTASTLYTGPITVTKTTTIKAIAQAPGLAISGVTSGTYTILVQAAPPTFSPPGGTYGAPQSVT